MNMILKMMLTNWLTSLPGGGLLATALPQLIELMQSGSSLWDIVQSPAFGKVLGGVGLLLAKDFNVTGGPKDNA